ncbi:MAG TPA: TIGR02996 domain-containing protein, partial [Gemmataceae bacterium]|nr:TIGR02996 domain-containing protein [Gemmataceae bacterium]
MSDEKALLVAIREHPHEDTPRLVYADWLQENGQPERAEFIRLQRELARLDEDDPQFGPKQAAADKLLKKWAARWRASLPGVGDDWPWERGFPRDDCGIGAADFLKLRGSHWRANPWHTYCVTDLPKWFPSLLKSPNLDRVHTFWSQSGVPAGDWVARAVACRGFRNVSRVWLADCRVTTAQLETLLDGWRDHRIEHLHLIATKIGNDGLRMLLAHPVLSGVRDLNLINTGLTAAGMRLL